MTSRHGARDVLWQSQSRSETFTDLPLWLINAKSLDGGLALWHKRLGHLGLEGIEHLADKALVTGLNVGANGQMELCKGCVFRSQPTVANEQRTFSS
jgi:hypothetical protein